MGQDYTDRLERVEEFETKFGVRFEGLYASVNSDDEDGPFRITVRGEVHARSKNSKIKDSLDVVLVVYDAKGRVVGKGDHYLSDDSFFAFDVFELDIWDVADEPVRLRLFPKAS
jgi:hypothetical protein